MGKVQTNCFFSLYKSQGEKQIEIVFLLVKITKRKKQFCLFFLPAKISRRICFGRYINIH